MKSQDVKKTNLTRVINSGTTATYFLLALMLLLSSFLQAQLAPNFYNVNQTLVNDQLNACMEFGHISNTGLGTYGKIRATAHSCNQLFISEYEFFGTHYAGSNTDWMEVPSRNGTDYMGAQGIALDVKLAANGGSFELRLRRIGGGCPGASVAFQIYVETNATFAETHTEYIASPPPIGYLAKPTGWQFPVTPDKFASSTKGIFVKNTGAVGIGNINPAYTLDVNGSIHSPDLGSLNPSLYLGSNTISNNIYQIQFGEDATNQLGMGYYTSSQGIWSRFGLGVHVKDNAEFSVVSTNWTNLFGIQGGTGNAFFKGNVGIGTNNPTQKLAVDGTVLAKKVKVSQPPSVDWPDYVFDSCYQLAPLARLEGYIRKNKHLPDVPSTKEVYENGLDLGDHQAVLLKKVEELTLYIIEQNKHIEKQERQNAKLEARLEALERMIKN